MRRWAAILLMLLVPLRVVAAETMVCLFQGDAQEVSVEAPMPDDCPMNQAHSGCAGCHLCMAFATPDAVPVLPASMPANEVLVVSFVHFQSAEVARALKPPIS